MSDVKKVVGQKTQPRGGGALAPLSNRPRKRKARKKQVSWFENFLQQWLGLITGIVTSLAACFAISIVVKFIFPTAGLFDPGLLARLPLAILCLYIINFMVQFIIKRRWKVMARYLNPNDDGVDWGDDFARATPTVRLWITLVYILGNSLVLALLL
jgi:hypothetical protein